MNGSVDPPSSSQPQRHGDSSTFRDESASKNEGTKETETSFVAPDRVTVTAVSGEWMTPPTNAPRCPPGLECLMDLDMVLIRQEIKFLKYITGLESRNMFKVLNDKGQQVYFVREESTIAQRIYCGPSRGFIYHVVNTNNTDLMRIRRDFRCCTGCYACMCESCRYYAAVEDKDGHVIGYVSNLFFCCAPLFGIFDEDKNMVAEIQGPTCPFQTACLTKDRDYRVMDLKTRKGIGKISKQWLGLLWETFSDVDNFRVCFPKNTDVKMKALMFAAAFILSVMLYENKH